VDFVFIREPLNTASQIRSFPPSWSSLAAVAALDRIESAHADGTLALVCTVLMGASVLTVGSTYDEIDRAGLRQRLAGDSGAPGQPGGRVAIAIYGSGAADRGHPSPHSFLRYLDRCTSSEDRLLIGGFMVEVPFYAQRLFAAGQGNFGGYPGSDASERFAYQRLQHQRVPFALVPGGDDWKDFTDRFSLIAAYLREGTWPLTDVLVNSEQVIHIFVNREMTSSALDPETGWPCFRDLSRTQGTGTRNSFSMVHTSI